MLKASLNSLTSLSPMPAAVPRLNIALVEFRDVLNPPNVCADKLSMPVGSELAVSSGLVLSVVCQPRNTE
jgi:hypothetical protein